MMGRGYESVGPKGADLGELYRRRMAQMLMQQGMSDAPLGSGNPLEGIARALTAGVGGHLAKRADEREGERNSAIAAELSKAFQPQTAPDPTVAGPRVGTGTTTQPDQSSIVKALMGSPYPELQQMGIQSQMQQIQTEAETAAALKKARAEKELSLEFDPRTQGAIEAARNPALIARAGGTAGAEAEARFPWQTSLNDHETNNSIRAAWAKPVTVAPGGSVINPAQMSGGAPPSPAPAGAPTMTPDAPPMPNAAGAPPAPAPGVLFRAPPSAEDQQKLNDDAKAKQEAIFALERQIRSGRALLGNPNTPAGRDQIATRERGTGGSSLLNFIPGTRGKDFEANLDTFKSQAFLPAVQQLRGMGALSNAEGLKLTDAIGALNAGMTDEAFAASLTQIIQDLEAAYSRATGGKAAPGAGGATGEWSIEVMS